MSQIDLGNMSLAELKSLQKQVAKAIDEFADKEKAKALAALEEKAREMGFSLSELTGAARKTTRKGAGVPKYRNPQNPEITWTGKGRRPDWVRDALSAGKSMDDLAI